MNEQELETAAAQQPAEPQQQATRHSIKDMMRQRLWLKDLKDKLMEAGLHHGVIPGRGDKPVLLQPGADLINTGLKVYPDFDIIDKIRDAETKEIAYVLKCNLVHKVSREVMATGVGSCSSRERMYARQSPTEVENTVLKMAAKRAKVCATLNIVGASDLFTQDIEDMPQDHFQQRGPRRASPPRAPRDGSFDTPEEPKDSDYLG